MSLVSNIFEMSPYIEVAARRIYWNSAWLVRAAARGRAPGAGPKSQASDSTWPRIEDFLRAHGASAGRIMVVHSSASALRPTGLAPPQIIQRLLALVGSEGTLAMPAFPRYDAEPQGIDRMRVDVSDLELDYDVQRSVPWTGLLPLRLMRHQGAVRSRHPLNSMVAVGPLAAAMMAHNLAGERSLPCGVNSSWKFCADNGALIVALGVDMAHSLTMIHVAEDAYEDQWPVRDWYRERKFRVLDKGEITHVVVRERRPLWAAHYAERTLSKDLRRAGLLARAKVAGVLVEVLDAQSLLTFLAARRSSAYPYYMIARRQMRRS